MHTRTIVALVVVLVVPLAASAQVDVRARAETDPVPNGGDAADDPAIWLHPTDRDQSLVIGTDKKGGLAVYDLEGNELAYLADGDMNNVDIRYGFELGGEPVDLVTAGNRTDDTVAIYRVDVSGRTLVDVAAGSVAAGVVVYGSCMYRSPMTGDTFVLVDSEEGEVVQLRLRDDGGRVAAEEVRRFDVGSQTEGCVADDELGWLYIGEEAEGIWRYGAEPDAGDARVAVDSTGSGGNLTADVEGLALYLLPGGRGYLVASSQGENAYAVYEREGDNAYVGSFRIVDGDFDRTSDTDGLDVTSAALGALYPSGLLVVQDGSNDDGNQNFKLVAWEDVAGAFSPSLAIDTSWDPRGGSPVTPGSDAGTGPSDGDAGAALPDAGSRVNDSGSVARGDAATTPAVSGEAGSGCSATVARGAPIPVTSSCLALVALIAARRRRRDQSSPSSQEPSGSDDGG